MMTVALPASPDHVLRSDGSLVDAPWPALIDGSPLPDATDVLLPLQTYLDLPQPAAQGVWLAPSDDPQRLLPFVANLPLIAIQFPKFADGRGFSIAHVLRRAGYRGDLRAFGNVLADQLFMLRRVGFTSFELPVAQSIGAARAALSRDGVAYQTAADGASPAFRRRANAAAERHAQEA